MLTCACVDFWASVLHELPAAKDLAVHALHGRMKQRVRDAKLAAFTAPGPGLWPTTRQCILVLLLECREDWSAVTLLERRVQSNPLSIALVRFCAKIFFWGSCELEGICINLHSGVHAVL